MNRGEMDRAKRRALNILDAWLDVTGVIPDGSGYRDELEGIVEDAVHCGAQAAGIGEGMTEKNRLTIDEAAGDYKHSLVRGLLYNLKTERLPEPVTEHYFAKSIGREWRFDAAYVPEKIAIEIEGGTGWKRDGTSRHLTPSGFRGDCEKYAEAAILGWIVLRFTPAMLRDGQALAYIQKALKARRCVAPSRGSRKIDA